ncbi:MAG: hypothetical protein ACP5KE_01300 [Candidatus Methanodesulfokora sp.]|nr:MAG: hypothetical protein C0200_03870 [Candidatus Korarchaeota archaeon]
MVKRPPRSKIASVKYGYRVRKRAEQVLMRSKSVYKCPNCGTLAVRRVFAGVWRCRKCGFEFTGGAWEPETSIATHAESALHQ